MPSSLRFVLWVLVLGALAVPPSILIQHQEAQKQAQVLAAWATGGNPDRGQATFRRLGCGACHETGAVSDASGQVGAPLSGLSKRAEFAGKVVNDPRSLIAWIGHPQSISPGVGMPDIPMSDQDARDMAAYLYALRGP